MNLYAYIAPIYKISCLREKFSSHQMKPYKQALGDSGKKELHVNTKISLVEPGTGRSENCTRWFLSIALRQDVANTTHIIVHLP